MDFVSNSSSASFIISSEKEHLDKVLCWGIKIRDFGTHLIQNETDLDNYFKTMYHFYKTSNQVSFPKRFTKRMKENPYYKQCLEYLNSGNNKVLISGRDSNNNFEIDNDLAMALFMGTPFFEFPPNSCYFVSWWDGGWEM